MVTRRRGVEWGTTYDLSGACPACGTGARQTSALFVNGEQLAALEGHRAGATYFEHFFVDEGIAAELETLGATGLSFRSVHAVMPDLWFAVLEPALRDSLLSWPCVLVTPRVRRVFRDAGVTSFDWLPTGRGRGQVARRGPGGTGRLDDRKEPVRIAYRASELRAAEGVRFIRVDRGRGSV